MTTCTSLDTPSAYGYSLTCLLVHSLTHSLDTYSLRGVCISIVGALFTSSGLCLQKIVHKRVSADSSIGPLYKQPTYIAGTHSLPQYLLAHSHTISLPQPGIAYVVLGQLLKTLVNVMLPQSTIAPLSCQTIIYSTFFEYLFVDGEMSVKTGTDSSTYSTHLLTHPLTHLLTHSLTHSLTHLLRCKSIIVYRGYCDRYVWS